MTSRWFPHHSGNDRLALAILIPVVVGLSACLVVICLRADFPSSLWVSVGGIITAACGMGGVIASAMVRRSLVGVSSQVIDAAGSILTVTGAVLTFVGFWQAAKRPAEEWDLGAMPTDGFIALIALLSVLSALLLFMAGAIGSRRTL
ncbi:hypothetical protein [Aeromicrobium sp. P5_D10]